jgi:leader peptidase (prepilin peptidase)/N-methyltransferase
VGTAVVVAAVVAGRLPTATTPQRLLLAAWLVYLHAGILLGAIDLAVRRLPTPVIATSTVLVGGCIAAAALAAHHATLALGALSAAGGLGCLYLVLALAAPTRIGMGDVRLAALSGMLLGTLRPAAVVVVGATLPYLFALPFALWQLRQPVRRDLPFGPFLVVATLTAACLT